MPDFSHKEIVQKFLETNAVDFNALGKFVAELGPVITAGGRGDYGVRFGHYNILACFKINPDIRLSPVDVDAGKIVSEVTGGG